MTTTDVKRFVRAGFVIAIVVAAMGCFPPPFQTTTSYQSAPVQTVTPSPTYVATTGYTPQYYNGYVVYFDSSGYPFYYLNGVVSYVPRTYYNYNYLINHYRTFGVSYQRWYSTEGYRLHSLRVNLGI